jgi:Prohead core protein serine protease
MLERVNERIHSALIVTEAKNDELRRIKLNVATVDTVNANGRYYSREVYETANNAAKEDLKAGKLWGLMDHPNWEDPFKGSVEQIVIKYDKLSIEGDLVMAEGVIVNTQKGGDLYELGKAGVSLGVSTNGYGTIRYQQAKDIIPDFQFPDMELAFMQTDFRYGTIDIVTTPSNSGGEIMSMEGEIMNLEELKKKDPVGYAALMAEAKTEAAKVAPVAATQDVSKLEKMVEGLTAQLAAKDATEASGAREALAVQMLVEAKLPKLPVAENGFDANASFEARVKRAAVGAVSLETAKIAIETEISERKVILGALAAEESGVNAVVIKSDGNKQQTETTVFDTYRSSLGML